MHVGNSFPGKQKLEGGGQGLPQHFAESQGLIGEGISVFGGYHQGSQGPPFIGYGHDLHRAHVFTGAFGQFTPQFDL